MGFFELKDLVNNFIQLHPLGSHVAVGCIQFIVWILSGVRLLPLAKPLSNVRSIIMGEAFYQLLKGHCVFSSVMRFFHICHHINLMWLLRVGVTLWFMIIKLLWMSITIG